MTPPVTATVIDWPQTLRRVPRAGFLPDRAWPFDPTTGRHGCVDRTVDPGRWWTAAEADIPITTQWDDGRHTGEAPGAVPTSSASQPSLVVRMLEALDAQPGHRALEVGTGTGWNAALLAHHLGDDQVVTVEVDPEVARAARSALAQAGLTPTVVVGDGMAGHADGGPYDRVVATCGVRRVPWAWVAQTRPGGVILAPWGTGWSRVDALVRLVVADDGQSAQGWFTSGLVQFMKGRGDRDRAFDPRAYLVGDAWPYGAMGSTTGLPAAVLADPYTNTAFAPGLVVAGCAYTYGVQADGTPTVWLYSTAGDGSWAAVGWPPGERAGEVWQFGPRRLWEEVEAAWCWWEEAGRPGVERFGLSVTSWGEWVWWDDPQQPVPQQHLVG